MKGRTTCPKCKHVFIVDVPKGKDTHDIVCPKCENNFLINTSKEDCGESADCSWEEHGEPRKTILSSIKPKTNKPMIAAILLIVVFCIGISTAAFSEQFIETSLDVAASAGLDSTVNLNIVDSSNVSLENATIKINREKINFSYNNNIYSKTNIQPGIQEIQIEIDDYETQVFEIMVTPFFSSEETITMKEGSGIAEKQEFDSSFCLIILVIFSIFPLIGTLMCLQRQHFDVAVAGSLLGILSFGFFLAGSIISIIAFVIVMKSRDEFENGKKGKIF